jgi:hypothetical protein
VLQEANYCSEHVDVGVERLVGQQGGDGVGDAKTVDGGLAPLVHVFENGITCDEI